MTIDAMMGHGGLFKTEGVGQRIMAAAVGAPMSVMETAGEGGPWGQAILASYMVHKADGETLSDYLNTKVFADAKRVTLQPEAADIEGMEAYIERFKKGIVIEQTAGSAL